MHPVGHQARFLACAHDVQGDTQLGKSTCSTCSTFPTLIRTLFVHSKLILRYVPYSVKLYQFRVFLHFCPGKLKGLSVVTTFQRSSYELDCTELNWTQFSSVQVPKNPSSGKTLYETLLNAVVLDLVACASLSLIRCFVSTLAFWMQPSDASNVTLWAMSVSSFHSVASHFVCLFFIPPCRRSLLAVCTCKRPKVASTSTVYALNSR